MIGGFHSPMEKECLDLLLRGRQPIVVCPARSIEAMRLPSAWRPAIDAGRLLVVSPFAPGHPRVTANLAATRNRLVAAIARAVLASCVARGSKIEHLCREVLFAGKPVFVSDPGGADLLAEAGAVPADVPGIRSVLTHSQV